MVSAEQVLRKISDARGEFETLAQLVDSPALPAATFSSLHDLFGNQLTTYPMFSEGTVFAPNYLRGEHPYSDMQLQAMHDVTQTTLDVAWLAAERQPQAIGGLLTVLDDIPLDELIAQEGTVLHKVDLLVALDDLRKHSGQLYFSQLLAGDLARAASTLQDSPTCSYHDFITTTLDGLYVLAGSNKPVKEQSMHALIARQAQQCEVPADVSQLSIGEFERLALSEDPRAAFEQALGANIISMYFRARSSHDSSNSGSGTKDKEIGFLVDVDGTPTKVATRYRTNSIPPSVAHALLPLQKKLQSELKGKPQISYNTHVRSFLRHMIRTYK